MAQADDEILDVVDIHDVVIGNIARTALTTSQLPPDGYVRAAGLLVVNSGGELWIPRRTMTKTIKPGGLDYSASGHIGTGETYEHGLLREVQEEINLELAVNDLVYIGTIEPHKPDNYYFNACYLYFSDEAPDFNHDDFTSFEWLTPEALQARAAAGERMKDSLQDALELVIAYRTAHGGHLVR